MTSLSEVRENYKQPSLVTDIDKLGKIPRRPSEPPPGRIKRIVNAVRDLPNIVTNFKAGRTINASYEHLHDKIMDLSEKVSDLHYPKDLSKRAVYREFFKEAASKNNPCLQEIDTGIKLLQERMQDPKKAKQLTLEYHGLLQSIENARRKMEDHFAGQTEKLYRHTVARELREMALLIEKNIPSKSWIETGPEEQRAAMKLAKQPGVTGQMSGEELQDVFDRLQEMIESSRYFRPDQRVIFKPAIDAYNANMEALKNPHLILDRMLKSAPGTMPVEQARQLLAEELPKLIDKALAVQTRTWTGQKESLIDYKLSKKEAFTLREIGQSDLSLQPPAALVRYTERALELIKQGFKGKEIPEDLESKMAKAEKRMAIINAPLEAEEKEAEKVNVKFNPDEENVRLVVADNAKKLLDAIRNNPKLKTGYEALAAKSSENPLSTALKPGPASLDELKKRAEDAVNMVTAVYREARVLIPDDVRTRLNALNGIASKSPKTVHQVGAA